VEWRVLDADDRLLQSFEVEVEAGVNTVTWDLQLDPELAVAAERARLDAAVAEGQGQGKKKGKEGKKASAEEAKPTTRADTPWAEAVRLERRLIVTPGSYKLQVHRGETSSTVDWTMEPAEPRIPRAKPKMKIRGEKDD
jgi:hypothetical protein